jgi:excinuclease ABC subunit C
MAAPKHLAETISAVPHKPGVYRYFDDQGRLLYVGKAKDLKKRVSSYFNKNTYDSGKTRVLVKKIADIQYIVVDTELDALLLENSLIKKYQPRYNINLKDDKTYPSIVIKKERFPRIFPTRQIIKDGSEYFGPYANVKQMHAVLDLIKKLYPLRNCNFNLSKENVEAEKFRVCLEYHLGNCLGPCVGKMAEEAYNENVAAIREIIRGNHSDVIKTLRRHMQLFSDELQFEKAEEMRRRIETLQSFQAKSTIVNPSIHNVDVFTIASDKKTAFVNYMKVNNGVIVHSYTSELRKHLDESDREILEFAIIQIRDRFHSQSREVFVSVEPEIMLPDVVFHLPQRGDKKKLMELSLRNAKFSLLDKLKQQEQTDPESARQRILESLQADLRLKELPIHIECFDNSNIQGASPASACVVFKNGKPSKDDYRKFNIKTVEGPDDFASMREVIYRRYKRLVDEGETLPQLIIVDGGKGQLSSAMTAIDSLDLRGQIAVIGIAKKLEEIYFPGDSIPVYINKRSPSLKLIQHLRNEAHRFSLKHHRDRRSTAAIQSELTEIRGVGFRTMQILLFHFKTVDAIRKAPLEELEKVVNKRVSNSVYAHFHS